ncbi:hypothetical protein KIF59_04525 [Enterobacter cloacae subsp. cloacae]|nr:hypothetical protein [Enterobacter cloacae subsp. cloacae]
MKTPKTNSQTDIKTASAPQKWSVHLGDVTCSGSLRYPRLCLECINNGKWYEPPVNFSGLAKSLRAAVHHSSPIYEAQHPDEYYILHPLLSRQDFSRLVLDYLVFANAILRSA